MSCPARVRFAVRLAACLCALAARPLAAQQTQAAAAVELEAALRLAESNSIELARLRAQSLLDRERLRLSYRSFLPSLDLSYTRSDTVTYAAPDSRSRQLSLAVQMLLYGGGARTAEHSRQRSALRLGEATIAATREGICVEIVRRFIQILTLQMQQRLLGDSQRSTAQQIAIAGEGWRLGEITELDYLEVAVAGADLDIQRAGLQLEERRMLFELQQALGLPPGQPLGIRGQINLDFAGLLESAHPADYLAAARRASLELHRRQAQLTALTEAARRARLAWIPSLSAEAQLSASGDQFPLTEPGFSVGLNLDFRTPLLPGSLGVGAGRQGGNKRSVSSAASLAVAEELDLVHDARLARLELRTAQAQFEDFQDGLEFAVRRMLQEREHRLSTLELLREKERLQGKRRELLALMLELGEVTRARFVEEDTQLAGLRVELVGAVAGLFDLEAQLLQRCGLPLTQGDFQRIIIPEAGP